MTQQEFIEKQFPHSTTTFGQDLRSLIRKEAEGFVEWCRITRWDVSRIEGEMVNRETLEYKATAKVYEMYERREK